MQSLKLAIISTTYQRKRTVALINMVFEIQLEGEKESYCLRIVFDTEQTVSYLERGIIVILNSLLIL